MTLVPFLRHQTRRNLCTEAKKKILAKTLVDITAGKKAINFESLKNHKETRNETSQTDSFILIYRNSLLLSTNKPSYKVNKMPLLLYHLQPAKIDPLEPARRYLGFQRDKEKHRTIYEGQLSVKTFSCSYESFN